MMVRAALDVAREKRTTAVYLLTTTATDSFPRFGFRRIPRAEVPAAVQRSVEFSSACPSTATVIMTDVAACFEAYA
jgi:amino-acid N-acetyltransferase